MTDSPRLTIAIPTLDRPEHLQHAIDSCLCQTLPVHVIVADQGASEKTAAVMQRYADHAHVEHVITRGRATCLWENWRLAAEAATTPFVAWLQDDDIISRVYASRVCQAFDRFPQALHWQARCYCSPDRRHAVWWAANGPCWGLLTIDMQPDQVDGSVVLASLYYMSWALSPGVAFRNGEEFRLAIGGMPSHCDLLAERLIVGAMAAQGPLVVDPIVAGYWHHHGANESYKQNTDGSIAGQRKLATRGLDEILDGSCAWREGFLRWALGRSPSEIIGWLNDGDGITNLTENSRHAAAIRQVLNDSLQGRVEAIPPDQLPPSVRRNEPEPVLIYE